MKNIDFPLFLELWNLKQGLTTPTLHARMARWLDTSWKNGDTRFLLMAFRASGKSTIVGLFSAYLLWVDPDIRILVLAADSLLAGKMVRNIRRVIESHPLTAHLKPSKADQWASDRFTVQRTREHRDPSVLAAGVTANITGTRADLIIYDDVEVPNTCATPDLRRSLRERLRESIFILTASGRQLFVGTPHSYFSIYADQPRKEINEAEVFLDGFSRLKIPILNDTGQSAWPQHYPVKKIEQIRKQSGPQQFASQMMLEPRGGLKNSDRVLSYYL